MHTPGEEEPGHYVYKKDNDYWVDLKFQDEYSLTIRVTLCNPTDPVLGALDTLFLFLFGFKDGVLNDLKAKKSYNHYSDEVKKDIIYSFVKQKDVFRGMYGEYTAAISSDEFYKRQGF